MRLKILRHYHEYRPHQVVEVDDRIAKELIEAKKAMKMTDWQNEDQYAAERNYRPRKVAGDGLKYRGQSS